MDVTTISSIFPQYGGERQQEASNRADKGLNSAQSGTNGSSSSTAEQLYQPTQRIRELAQSLHGLNIKSANQVLEGVSEEIKEMNPWRLAELQQVTASSMIASAYV